MKRVPDISAEILPKIDETGNVLGLRVSWIRTADELTRSLDLGLASLYQDVFSGPPYNERFTFSDVKGFFEETLSVNGFLFVAHDQANGHSPVSFVASVPLSSDKSLQDFVTPKVQDTKTTSYFSEDGTHNLWRRKGVSSKMKDILLRANFAAGYNKVLLRTSIYNYKQISAVCKAGGIPIQQFVQNVESTKADGNIAADPRSFYVFEPSCLSVAAPWVIPHVAIARPGGNDTAVVFAPVDRSKQGAVSLLIQDTFPGVEQVMFVEKSSQPSAVRGQMAGGEFCGNATRSLGFLQLDGRDGDVLLEISGASKPLRVDVSGGMSKTQIPILKDPKCIRKLESTGEYIADLEGISFLITYADKKHGATISSFESIDDRKAAVLDTLRKFDLTKHPASGVLVLSPGDNGALHLDPYVFVRDTGTLYYESGCGSGSTAVGLMLSKEAGKPISNQQIVQPSGMSLYVSVARDGADFAGATVSGPVDVLFNGKMYVPREWAQKRLAL